MEQEKEIRTDLWDTMTTSQLQEQIDLIVTKMGLLQTMMGRGATAPGLTGLYKALEHGLEDITNLLHQRLSGKN